MKVTLEDLRRIAEVEFGALVVDSAVLSEKMRLFLSDTSYIDAWLSRQISGRFGFHWERQHLDGTLYRYDNFPDPAWEKVTTYPYHFHNGSQVVVEAAPFATDPLVGFREFLRFVETRLSASAKQ